MTIEYAAILLALLGTQPAHHDAGCPVQSAPQQQILWQDCTQDNRG
jgi:hypothetical protein